MNTTCANYPCPRPSGVFLSSFVCSLGPYESLRLALVVLYIAFARAIADPAVTQHDRVFAIWRRVYSRDTLYISRASRRRGRSRGFASFTPSERRSVSECVITVLLRFYCAANVELLATSAEYVTIVTCQIRRGKRLQFAGCISVRAYARTNAAANRRCKVKVLKHVPPNLGHSYCFSTLYNTNIFTSST